MGRWRQVSDITSSQQSSLFVTPSPNNVRPPSIVGGGYSIDVVDTPFDFDKGSIVHFDNHATFYSLNASKEYEALMEEYKSSKSAFIAQDMTQFAFDFYREHPYMLQVAYDVSMLAACEA